MTFTTMFLLFNLFLNLMSLYCILSSKTAITSMKEQKGLFIQNNQLVRQGFTLSSATKAKPQVIDNALEMNSYFNTIFVHYVK